MDAKDNFKDYLKEIPIYFFHLMMPLYLTTVSMMLLELSSILKVESIQLNPIFTFFAIGIILGQLTSAFYNKKFKKIIIISFSFMIIIILLILIILFLQLISFFIIYFFVGYFIGILGVQAMQYLLENNIKNKSRIIMISLMFYPLGHLIAPFIPQYFLKNNLSWKYSFILLIIITIFIYILFIIFKYNINDKNNLQEYGVPLKNIFNIKTKNRLFGIGLVLLFLFTIPETIIITWSPTFLRMVRNFDITTTGFTVTVFWFGIFIGRFVFSFIVGRNKLNNILLILSSIGLAGFLFISLIKSSTIIIFAFIAGIGNSAIIPLCLAFSNTVIDRGRPLIIAITSATINISVSLTPLIVKAIAGFNINFSIMLGPLSVMLGIFTIIIKIIYEKILNLKKNTKHEY